jgi:nucleotide-binding universal stress UspA family protein
MTEPQRQTVVVGIDYSETGLLAFRRALNLARGTLHVVHVVESRIPMGTPAMPVEVPPAHVNLDEESATLRRYVEDQVAFASQESTPPSVALVVSHLALGSPAEELVQLASDLEADLIVVGTHGRRGVKRFILGSIAERTVRLATCPVLVERPKGTAKAEAPRIEPPCPACLATRRETGGRELWCNQHRERHGRRHVYHSPDVPSAFPSTRSGLGSVS